jgi:Outer membrane protein beta-barrel domain
MNRPLALLTLCLASGAATAADNGFYLGGGVGRSDFDLQAPLDGKDTTWKAIAGFRLLDSLGVELNYTNFGKATVPSGIACIALVGTNCPSTTTVEGNALSAFAVGFLDFPVVDLFGKIGLSQGNAKLRTPGFPTFAASDKNTDIAWGAGAQVHFLSLAVRAEFERYKIFGGTKLDMASVSFIYTFL